MPSPGRPGRQLRSWLFKASVHDEVDAELEFHLAMRERELMARGHSPEEARRLALQKLGDLPHVRRQMETLGMERDRAAHASRWWSEVTGDVHFAARQLRRSLGFTLVAVVTLALGMGATTAVFSLLHAIVLRPLPFDHPERVVSLSETYENGPGGSLSAPAFVTWQRAAGSLSHMAPVEYWSFNLADDVQPERVRGARVGAAFFGVFGVQPLLGRTFLPTDDQAGNEHVVVLSHGLWRQRFDANPAIVGTQVRLDGEVYDVIGVMPERFDYLDNAERLWVPLVLSAQRLSHPDEHYLDVVGRLREGATIAGAMAEAVPVTRQMVELAPLEYRDRSLHVTPFDEQVGGPYRNRLLLLLGCVAFVLLIACANVANLLLARGAARAREIAIRGALGAGRRRVMRQLITESAVLATLGAVLGCGLAMLGVKAVVAFAPSVPRLRDASVSGPALLFALGVTAMCTLVFGLLPALRASRFNLQGTLREGGRGSSGIVRDRLRTTLIAGEVALALVLLTGAGLLVRTAIAMHQVDTGFDPSNVVSARVTLPAEAYPDRERLEQFFRQVTDELRSTPGIRAASVTSQSPLGVGGSGNGLMSADKPIDPRYLLEARSRFIDPAHFPTMGIRLIEGRNFTDRDVRGAPRVMVISRAVAEAMFPGQSAIGKRLACCEGSPQDPMWKEVVGVVENVAADSLLVRPARPIFYIPTAQIPDGAWDWIQRTMTIVVRHDGNETSAIASIRAAVRAADRSIPLFDIANMNTRFQRAYALSRFNTMLLSALAIVGLLLAAVGIYGVISYFVGQRTQEIGVRIALGASVRQVVTMVSWQGLRPVLAGIAAGCLLSLAATRLLAGALYKVTPNDPLTFIGVALLLLVVALGAAFVPARRAARVPPTEALGS